MSFFREIFRQISVLYYQVDIINDDSIDLVVIVTPAFAHYDYAKELLSAGKNVLCDKPLVETLEQAKELVALAKEKNLFFMPFQNRRFDSDFLTVKKSD